MISMAKCLCHEKITENCSNAGFRLHSHNEYEILMFLDGNSKYIIEDKIYTLEKGDVIIAKHHELHRIYHNTPAQYHRIVIKVPPQFFEEKNCAEYVRFFDEKSMDSGSKIDNLTVKSSGLYDAVMRFKKYSDNFKNANSPITDSIIVEIFYIISKAVSFSAPDTGNSQVKSIIAYINENFTQKITLDTLAEKFFISKYHLCRIFRKATGLTVLDYIRSKRLIFAKELISKGYNKTEAALMAGFNDYSLFYRARESGDI